MPCISGVFDPTKGLLLPVAVTKVNPTNAHSLSADSPVFKSLIDTGASVTCISGSVVEKIGLTPSGKRQMVSASHQATVNMYVVDFAVPFGNIWFFITGMPVMEFYGSPDFDILLGRDIICQGHLSMSHNGAYTFCL